MRLSNTKIKKLVKQAHSVDQDQLNRLFDQAEKEDRSLADLLVDMDLVSDDQMGELVATELGLEFVDLDNIPIQEDALQLIPEVMARKQKVIAFEKDKKQVKVAMVNPSNLPIVNRLKKKIHLPISIFYTTSENLSNALSNYHHGLEEEFERIIEENIDQAKAGADPEDLPVVKIVDSIINYAYENKASDVHIEPSDRGTIVRFRIDGILHDIIILPSTVHNLIISRIKILSKLRTDEHHAAQDGKMQMPLEAEKLDVRVSIMPVTDGEKIVLRLLSAKSRHYNLEDLGMSSADLVKVKKEYSKPYGMVLSTGPTGSGKTTTMYSIMKILNRREINISTIEDPVEYDLEGVNQTQVNNRTNLTFANGLRSILRQDPDIIMVGEIRDEETADIAINSAMTGHLVLSTLHTNDAATALPRFLEMGIEPFLVASTVNVIIAQRLVRKICSQCVMSMDVEIDELKENFSVNLINKYFSSQSDKVKLFSGQGCSLCSDTGYRGRIGIFEVLDVTDSIRKLIMERADVEEITKVARQEGMKTMIEDGITKVLTGVTTIEEVLRATRE